MPDMRKLLFSLIATTLLAATEPVEPKLGGLTVPGRMPPAAQPAPARAADNATKEKVAQVEAALQKLEADKAKIRASVPIVCHEGLDILQRKRASVTKELEQAVKAGNEAEARDLERMRAGVERDIKQFEDGEKAWYEFLAKIEEKIRAIDAESGRLKEQKAEILRQLAARP